MATYTKAYIKKLNEDIKNYFPHLFPITSDMKITHDGVSRLVMIDRYSQKDKDLVSLTEGDLVITIVKYDPKFPTRGLGYVRKINKSKREAIIEIIKEFRNALEDPEEYKTGLIKRELDEIEKPLELYYEQIAKRVAYNLSRVEKSEELRNIWFKKFYDQLRKMNFVPAGRVLYGAGSDSLVTYFNCFVMPFIEDSREGIAEHRKKVMEIMSRGGGVGTNGSTLRPKHARAKRVGGRSSGAVSWLHDLSQLTHLVEQGGSRRGAQMIMLSIWHPDIIEFIISKMQNPKILHFLIETSTNEKIINEAKNKLKFEPLSESDRELYETIVKNELNAEFPPHMVAIAKEKLAQGGTYTVNNIEFLSGANISVNLTHEFMEAVEKDLDFDLKFPDLDRLTKEEKEFYDKHWHEIGDVREWEALGYPVKVYYTIKARELWQLINICATYSGEPGIFFIDNANDMTNAKAYGQKVVATNPCGEQPLAPYSVCNLAAINLANMIDKQNGKVKWSELEYTVQVGVRMQDNVIDATPYFLEENKIQALGERRIGMGIMGLHDLLIWAGKRYGSASGNELVNRIMKTIATTAYKTSIQLAKEKGAFPFLTDRDKFIQTGYMKNMPEEIKDDILHYGIRNSHLLTIAPTGSTGTMVGVSTGLEPYYSFKYYRSGRLGKFIEVNAKIVDEWLKCHPEYTEETLPNIFVSAMDLKPEEHADIQCIIQRWVDSSISKTVNAPKGYTVEEVARVYERLYKGGAKGGTVYVDGSRDAQVLTLTKDEKQEEQLKLEIKVEEHNYDQLENVNPERTKHGKNIGTKIGDLCPICNEGEVVDSGGCNTCSNCGAQLKCEV